MLTTVLTIFLGLSLPASSNTVTQTKDGTWVFRHRDTLPTLRHRDHRLPKGRLFADDESERYMQTTLKGGL